MWPHSIGSFDIVRQLCRTDVVFGDNKAVLLVKWSKIIKDRTTTKTITIPHLGNPILCPVTAIKSYYASPQVALMAHCFKCANVVPGCP